LRGRGGHLDGIEHVLSGFLSCFVGPAPDAFALERREEGLGDGIVAAIAAVVPGLTDQLGLPGIVLSPLAPRALLPGIEATGLDAQTTTHQANLELVTMLGNRRLSHFVSLAKSGARSWVYRFMLNGKSRDIGLGAAGADGISLAEARDARDALRLKVKAGIDPLEERQKEAATALAMKAGREHRVPLSQRAVEILLSTRILRKDWLFPATNGGSMSGMAMSMLLRRMKVDVTVHGFRSGFRDWCAECTSYAHEVAEMALAHTIGNKVERAYRRGDLFEKRRRLMDDWASYCATIPVEGTNVTPFRKLTCGG